MTYTIKGNVVFPDGVRYREIVVKGDSIVDIKKAQSKGSAVDYSVPDGQFIAPGFIDLQINGGFGKEFKTDEDALNVVAANLVRFGTTAFCPTITTTDLPRYRTHSEALLRRFVDHGLAKVLGFHFEGPALNPKKVGAQNAALLRVPRELNTETYIGCDRLRMVTIAPELDGAEDLIASLKKRGVRIGIGHSVVSYDELERMFDPTVMLIVHVFNAMEPLASREPGLAGGALINDEFTLSLIADGIHTHPGIVSLIWKAKADKRRVICISDGSAVAGLPTGTYSIGDRTITREKDRATLPNGTLVGSVLTMNRAVKNMMAFTGCQLHEAVNTVSLNPATYLGLADEIGQVAIGRKADFAIVDADLDVIRTYVQGRQVYDWNSSTTGELNGPQVL